jgi:hypothetical protein
MRNKCQLNEVQKMVNPVISGVTKVSVTLTQQETSPAGNAQDVRPQSKVKQLKLVEVNDG